MDIELGLTADKKTFTNTIVEISRQPVISSHININGSVQIQKAPEMKRVFTVTLIRPTSTEVDWIEAEHDRDVTLDFKHKGTTYNVRFIEPLDKSTGMYEITFTLQEV